MKKLVPKHALLLTLLAAAVLPYVIGLGDSTIWDANEAFYAETARDMVESGDYINPTFNDQPRFNKPVLSYWAVAASYHLFGVSERSERLPIAAAALVLIGTVFGLGRATGSVQAGMIAALAFATTPRVLMFARRIIIDVWITMFMALTLLFFVLAERHDPAFSASESPIPNPESRAPNRRRRYLMLMYAAAGLGALTKGPVAVVLPALAFGIYFVLERRLRDLRHMMIPTGVAIVAAIVLPWYIALYVQHGWVHIKEFFVDENLIRYAQPMGAPRRGLWFYGPVLLTDLFPWSVLLPVALAAAWRAFRGGGSATTAEDRARRILLVWIATIVLFFTFSRTKQDLYIFPVVPAEAALIGAVLAHKRASFSDPRDIERDSGPLSWSLTAAGLMVAALGLAVLALVVMAGRYPLAGSLAVSLVALVGGALALIVASQGRLALGTIALGATLVTLSWIFVLVSLPDFERYKPVAPLVETIKQRAKDNARVGYYQFAFPSMAFYMRGPVFEYFDVPSLQQIFGSGHEVYCLMTAEDYRAVKESLPGPTYVIERRPLFDVKLRTLLEGTALPDIVLVSNRP